jgi:hypothetical protein
MKEEPTRQQFRTKHEDSSSTKGHLLEEMETRVEKESGVASENHVANSSADCQIGDRPGSAHV